MKKQIKTGIVCALAAMCAGSVLALSGCEIPEASSYLTSMDLSETGYAYKYILVDGELHSGSATFIYTSEGRYGKASLGYNCEFDCGKTVFTTCMSCWEDLPENCDYVCEKCFPELAK